MLLRHDFSPQNGQGMFSHHHMLGGSSDHHDRNGVIGLNLVPSDFSHPSSVMPPQQMKQSYYIPKRSASPMKSSTHRPGSPVESAPSGEATERSNGDTSQSASELEPKGAASSDQEQQRPRDPNGSPSKDLNQGSIPQSSSSVDMANEVNRMTSQPSDAQPASKELPSAPASHTSAGSSSSRSGDGLDKRPLADNGDRTSASPQKRQRVVV